MRARLYRGPHDGRVLQVPDNQTSITLRRPKAGGFLRHVFDSIGHTTLIDTIDDEYRIVLLGKPWDHYPATHPDGTVFFEWTQKRGTKIQR
jgi:hypothetical protein